MSRLGRRQGADLVARVTGDKPLPAEVVEQIVARTDGVPLFVEELTKTVLESGLLDRRRRSLRAAGPAAAARDPDDAARLADGPPRPPRAGQGGRADRRRDRPRVLARAARRRVADLPEAELQRRPRPAGRLRAGLPPRHAARGDLQLQARAGPGRGLPVAAQVQAPAAPRPDRRRCSRSGSRRSSRTAARAARPSLDRGGPGANAQCAYWQQAGERAAERSANVGSDRASRARVWSCLRRCRTASDARHGGAELCSRDRDPPDVARKGYAAPEVERAYGRARELCERLGDRPSVWSRCCGALSTVHVTRGELGAAVETRRAALGRAEQGDDRSAIAARASMRLGQRLYALGAFRRGAIEHLERGLRHLRSPGPTSDARFARSATTRSSRAERTCAWSLWLLGYPDQASTHAATQRWPRPRTRASAHLPSHRLCSRHLPCLRARQLAGGARCARASWFRSRASRAAPSWRRGGRHLARLGHGAPRASREAGCARIRQGMAMREGTGSLPDAPYLLGLLADAHARAGQPTKRSTRAGRGGWRSSQRTGERWYEAELHRLEGELPGSQAGEPDRGGSLLRSAQSTIARRQQAKSWSCAPRPASPGCGRSRASAPRPATCSRRSTAGSPRASIPPT